MTKAPPSGAADRSPKAPPSGAADHSNSAPPWWRSAVVYQVYIRSFADGDGDGIGDIAGLRSRLPYLAGLGVDALWITPWYLSPMRDGGYDVADFRTIDPSFGTLPDARAAIAEAHRLGLRVLLDLVPNHVSDQHPWFREALAAGPAGSRSAERARFIFRDGRGPAGTEPPNDWRSNFGGSAWTRVTEADGRPGQWYLHLFAPQQPDLDWTNPEVREEFVAIMRFWFELGVDGFRIDVAHGLAKAEGLPDASGVVPPPVAGKRVEHPHWDRDEVHEIYRTWRALADEYEDPKVFVGEAWVHSPERLARYVRADELHTAFNFDFPVTPWQAERMRSSIDATLRTHRAVGAAPTWVLSNHDTVREVSRYARPQGVGPLLKLDDVLALPADPSRGLRRARAAALLMLALPGGAYIYQGEELGLPEVEDLPDDVLRDPGWELSGHTARGRDGCRVPIPWSGPAPPFGFSPPGARVPPWLPQPASWRELTVAAETGDEGSTLELYRRALALRHEHPALGDGELRWLPAPAGALAFAREPGFACIVNVSAGAVAVPPGTRVLIASGPLTARHRVPQDTAVWVAVGAREETPT
ncbi:MAG TPA: alpha-amylase family glycosyl hydrolase [Solirubrobacteraceae bacterium]|nr:alpha-amylase family glycosyl hydrolase [Solirubrobacteraceae bacterium]